MIRVVIKQLKKLISMKASLALFFLLSFIVSNSQEINLTPKYFFSLAISQGRVISDTSGNVYYGQNHLGSSGILIYFKKIIFDTSTHILTLYGGTYHGVSDDKKDTLMNERVVIYKGAIEGDTLNNVVKLENDKLKSTTIKEGEFYFTIHLKENDLIIFRNFPQSRSRAFDIGKLLKDTFNQNRSLKEKYDTVSSTISLTPQYFTSLSLGMGKDITDSTGKVYSGHNHLGASSILFYFKKITFDRVTHDLTLYGGTCVYITKKDTFMNGNVPIYKGILKGDTLNNVINLKNDPTKSKKIKLGEFYFTTHVNENDVIVFKGNLRTISEAFDIGRLLKDKSIYADTSLGKQEIPSKASYQSAFNNLDRLAKENCSDCFKQSVFVVENAFYGNKLSYVAFSDKIYFYSQIIKSWNQFNPINYKYEDSLNFSMNWGIYNLIKDTITILLNDKKLTTNPFSYNFHDFDGSIDWTNTFVTKLLSTQKGNCRSLPYLYKILADEIGATC